MAIACASSRQPRHEQELDSRCLGRARASRPAGRVHAGLSRQSRTFAPHSAGRRRPLLLADYDIQRKGKTPGLTAIGIAKDQEPYPIDLGEGFCPFRRDVKWLKALDAPIAPLLEKLEFAAGKRNWGDQFRPRLFPISDHDLQIIAAAMKVKLPE